MKGASRDKENQNERSDSLPFPLMIRPGKGENFGSATWPTGTTAIIWNFAKNFIVSLKPGGSFCFFHKA